ncbi:MAG: hypothetical protein EAZ52_03980 [Alphaproteobacteria bacterium]|nr:MAG: hypothetical protein EAZ66_01020 [Alphaproteobacteria bacterium]TAF76508.1 MAG: hypothetical protein EAZ52_03980 [Alphaproteobacteria bacterium]
MSILVLFDRNNQHHTTFYDGMHAVARAVDVSVFATGIEICDKEQHRKFFCSYENLHIMDVPRDGQSGYAHCTQFPESQLLLDDALFRAIKPHVQTKTPWNIIAMIGILVVLVGLIVFVTIPASAPVIAAMIPATVEKRLGALVFDEIKRGKLVCPQDAQPHMMLQSLVDDFAHANNIAPVNIVIVHSSEINAFALPARQIVLFDGLLQQTATPEALAGVIAHEIGHVAYNHSMESFVRILGMGLIVEVATGGGGTMLFLGSELYHNVYSREKEQQADEFAARAMHAKQYDVHKVADFFARSVKEESGLLEQFSWLSTHPTHQSRIDFFTSYPQEHSSRTPVMTDAQWRVLQKMKGCGFHKERLLHNP